MNQLRPRSVLLTGANRGLGLEFVRQLLRLPTPPQKIFATCRNPSKAQELQELSTQHLNVQILPLDVQNYNSIQENFDIVKEELKDWGLNLLINNAGMVFINTFDSESEESMLTLYKIHVIGSLKMTQIFMPLLKKAAETYPQKSLSCNRAAVINISSASGSMEELLGWQYAEVLSYRCSKAALNMLTRCQSKIFKTEGILCCSIHPGWVQTDMGNSGPLKAPLKKEESIEGMLKVFSTLSEKDSGNFYDWEGKVVPW